MDKTTTSNTHKQQVLFIHQINLAYKLKLNRYEINEKLNTSPLQVTFIYYSKCTFGNRNFIGRSQPVQYNSEKYQKYFFQLKRVKTLFNIMAITIETLKMAETLHTNAFQPSAFLTVCQGLNESLL